jgi:hypothetical protein
VRLKGWSVRHWHVVLVSDGVAALPSICIHAMAAPAISLLMTQIWTLGTLPHGKQMLLVLTIRRGAWTLG